MAKSVEDIIQLQLGGQALQIAQLLAENAMLKEKVTALELELKNAGSNFKPCPDSGQKEGEKNG